MMQGDAYSISFNITTDGDVITPTTADDVEITIGKLAKSFVNNQITFVNGEWRYPLTQTETFNFGNAPQPCQVRVKFSGGDVVGAFVGSINVLCSISKAVL